MSFTQVNKPDWWKMDGGKGGRFGLLFLNLGFCSWISSKVFVFDLGSQIYKSDHINDNMGDTYASNAELA